MLFSKLEIPEKLKGKKINHENTKMDKDWQLLILDKKNSTEKTELLSQLIHLYEKQVMWYHLDFLDNNESIFLEYLKENFKKVMKGIEFEEQSTQDNLPVPFCYLKRMEQLIYHVTEYITDKVGKEFCLIFDCFHEIENKIIYKMIQQLVDNKPKSLRLVIASEHKLSQFEKYDNETSDRLHKKAFGNEEFAAEFVMPQKNSFHTVTTHKKEKDAIFISFFNGFSVKNMENGKEVYWRTKKEKQLFAYFFSLNGKSIDRSHLLEILWNDQIPENGIAMLHNMIYHIRKEMEQILQENIIQYKKKNTG